MDIKELRAFIVVAEELNFRKSADILGMSQPPLTRLISALEEEIGTKLFERSTRKVKMTSAGIFLLHEAREVVAKVEDIKKELRSIEKIRKGEINVGFSTASFLARLPKIIDEFKVSFPKISMNLHQASRKKILTDIKNGTLDIGFIEGAISELKFNSILVKDEPLGALLPNKHPLAKRKELKISDLKNETIILHPRKDHPDFFDAIHQLFESNGVHLKTYIKAAGESCPYLVSLGKGVLLTIEGSQSKVPEETVFVPIPNLHMPVSAVWDKDNDDTVLKSFISFVSENKSLGKQTPGCLYELMTV